MEYVEAWATRIGRRDLHHLVPALDLARGHIVRDGIFCWCCPSATLCSEDNDTIHVDITHYAWGHRVHVVPREAT